jgi:DNA-binding phage protein
MANRFWTELEDVEITRAVTKHGTHDQKTHGNWATGEQSSGTPEDKRKSPVRDAGMESRYKKAKFRESMSQDERNAINDYIQGGHNLNRAIREGESEYLMVNLALPRATKGLDSMIDRAPTLNGDRLYRITSATSLDGLKVGDVIEDKAYVSTTTKNLLDNKNGNLLLHLATVSKGEKSMIRIDGNFERKGLYVRSVASSTNPTAEFEHEVILPRNTQMRYKGFTMYPVDSAGSSYFKVHDFERINP